MGPGTTTGGGANETAQQSVSGAQQWYPLEM